MVPLLRCCKTTTLSMLRYDAAEEGGKAERIFLLSFFGAKASNVHTLLYIIRKRKVLSKKQDQPHFFARAR